MRAGLLFAILIVAVAADFNFQGNVTATNAGQFNYRDIEAEILNVPNVLEGVFYEATSLVNGTNQKDVVTGAFFVFPADNDPPTAFLSFFTSYATYQNAKAGATNGQPFSFNTQTSDTVVTKTFVSLEEVNTTTNITVNTVNLVDLNWALLQTQAPTTPAQYLNYITLKGTDPNIALNFSISISAVFSQVLGLLNIVGAPVVTPKSIETTVTIANYPYKSLSNALRLNFVIGTAQANFTLQGSLTVTSGNGTNANYVQVSDQVQADGNVKTATITVSAQQSTGSGVADAALTERFSTQRTATKVSVQFPAGATNIVFDPTAGAGTAPQVTSTIIASSTGNSNAATSKTGSASQFAPIFALLFFLAALVL
jgi:hypothetical protein